MTALSLWVVVAIAQQDSIKRKKPDPYVPDGKYCVMLEAGKVTVTLNGKAVKNDVELKNGNRITSTGTILRKDGSIQMLKPGTCVYTEGEEVERASRK